MTVMYLGVVQNMRGSEAGRELYKRMMTVGLSTVSTKGFLIISSTVLVVRVAFMFCKIHSLSTLL